MKIISVDGGALAGKANSQFGTYTFSKGLINALIKNKHKQNYRFYLQAKNKDIPAKYTTLIRPKPGWMKLSISLRELIKSSSVFLALNQALPWYCLGKKIVFCHGTAPIDFPELYPDSQKRMRQQIKQMFNSADWIVVGSEKLKTRLNDIYREENRGEINQKIKVINYGIGQDYLHHKPQKRQPIILYVGSSHPIKNLPFLFQAFLEFLKIHGYGNYRFSIIGIKKPLNIPNEVKKQVDVIGHLEPYKLCLHYRQAQCLVTASLEESFNLPVLEALSQKTSVVGTKSAIIPEFKPYVNIAPESPRLFAQQIRKTIEIPKTIDVQRIRQQFSWQHYVQELTKLYE